MRRSIFDEHFPTRQAVQHALRFRTAEQIAAELGVSKSAFSHWLRRRGWQLVIDVRRDVRDLRMAEAA